MRYSCPLFLFMVWCLSSGGGRAETLPRKPAYANWKMVALSSHIVIGDLELVKMLGEESRRYRPKPGDRFFPAVITVTSVLKGNQKERQIQFWMPLDRMPHLPDTELAPASLKYTQVLLFLQKDLTFKGFYSTTISGVASFDPALPPVVRAVKTEIENQRQINERFTPFWNNRLKKYEAKMADWLSNIKNAGHSNKAIESINSISALGRTGYVLLTLHLTDETIVKDRGFSFENRRPDAEEGLVHHEAKTIGEACAVILAFAIPDGAGAVSHDAKEHYAHMVSAWRIYTHYIGLTVENSSVSCLPTVTIGTGEAAGIGRL